MDDKEFNSLADATLAQIEHALEASEADIDFELAAGGVLEIEFENGSKIIINRHGVGREIWVAAKAGGFHFRRDGEVWLDTRDGTELMAKLSTLASQQAGEKCLSADQSAGGLSNSGMASGSEPSPSSGGRSLTMFSA